MKLNSFPLLLLLATSLACKSTLPNQDPTGETMPAVSGEDLDGLAVTLPAGEQPMILLVGYAQNAQFDLDRWLLGLVQSETPLPIYEVPTIPGMMPGMASGWIDDGMRGGIPPEDWASVVTIYGDDAGDLAAFTGTELPNNGRVLLLDSAGRVVWFHDRGYSAGLMAELDSAARALAGDDSTIMMTSTSDDVLFDFTRPEAAQAWRAMDDRVMGGSSLSSLQPVPATAAHAAFAGELVVEGGGFASVRIDPDRAMDLSDASAIELMVRGDGRTYQLRLGDDGRYDGVRWTAEFRADPGSWQTVRIPMEELRPTWRGRTVRGMDPMKRSEITSVGLLLADKNPGDFRLEVQWIRLDRE